MKRPLSAIFDLRMSRHARHRISQPLTIRGVAADRVRDQLPWLEGLYRGLFRDLAQQGRSLPVVCAEGPRHTVVLNVQLGTDGRYETHIDTNPIQGLYTLPRNRLARVANWSFPTIGKHAPSKTLTVTRYLYTPKKGT